MVEYKVVHGFYSLTEENLNVIGSDNWYLAHVIGDTAYFLRVLPSAVPIPLATTQE